MTALVLVSGTLFREPEQRTSKAGKPFVTATLKAKDQPRHGTPRHVGRLPDAVQLTRRFRDRDDGFLFSHVNLLSERLGVFLSVAFNRLC